jgi:hypothetical protein
MHMFWSSRAPLEAAGTLGPMTLLPLLPPFQGTVSGGTYGRTDICTDLRNKHPYEMRRERFGPLGANVQKRAEVGLRLVKTDN